jgi:hypothetical protein
LRHSVLPFLKMGVPLCLRLEFLFVSEIASVQNSSRKEKKALPGTTGFDMGNRHTLSSI